MKFTRIFAAIAVASSLAFSVSAQADDQAASFTDVQKTQIQGVVHDYLMKNPEVIADAVQGLQQKQMDQMRSKGQEAALKNASQLFKQTSDPVIGNADGKVTMVEFFDYQCPHCVEMDPDLVAILKANPNLRVVMKEFPIRGPISLIASKAALAAAKQGKYMEMHEALMKSAQSLSQEKVMALAKTIGLDTQKLKADMDSAAVDAQVKATYKLAQELQLYGTPAIFIAKSDLPKDAKSIEFIPGQVDQKYLQGSIDKVSH
jgi:protein-disulfide isomerase